MKKIKYTAILIYSLIAFASYAFAKNISELSHEDMIYLADIEMHTATGRGYFVSALSDHSENWKEVMEICSPLSKKEKFGVEIVLAIRPSGEVTHISIDSRKAKLELEPFFNCIGENLMRGGYPEHPFSVYYFKFLATDRTNYKKIQEKVEVKNTLTGIWKSELNGAYIKVDEHGKAYYCLYNPSRSSIKIVSLGSVNSDNEITWGKFLMIRKSEVFNLKEDLKSDFLSAYHQELEGGALKTVEYGSIQNSYLKTDTMDILCD